MLSYPFAQNTCVELFDTAQNLVVGYAFASAGSKPAFQEQRWVLYHEYQSPPSVAVILRTPTNPALRFASLSAFLDALRLDTKGPLWRTGARYVKALGQIYAEFPRTEPVPPPFPTVALPERLPSVGQQIDDHPAALDSGGTNIRNGYVFGTSIVDGAPNTKQNVEYWVTLSGYTPARDNAQVVLQHDTDSSHQTLTNYLDDMRNQAGATLTVASCVYVWTIPLNP